MSPDSLQDTRGRSKLVSSRDGEREERERDGQRSGLTCLLLRVRQEVMDEKKKKKIKKCVCVV